MSDGHRFLVLGAAGFIGRHVVHRLVNTEGLASFVRAVDKTLPAMAFLTEDQAKSFANPKVEFKQANLCNPQSVEKAFDSEIPFDYVINLAAVRFRHFLH
jgi:nucleoside-diphosphate-sugar epimerase